MQTYGLKVGDKVTLNEKAGDSPIGFYGFYRDHFERVNVVAWTRDYYIIQEFRFLNGATFAVLENMDGAIIATELKKFSSTETERSIKDVKVGDWVVILKSKGNWNDAMDGYVGRIVEVTTVTDHTSTGHRIIRFHDDGGWQWETKNKHFRFATQQEIAGCKVKSTPPVIFKFASTKISVIPGSDKAHIYSYGDVTAEELKRLIDSFTESGKELLGYRVRVELPNDTKISFGCQTDTLEKLLQIYNTMIGNV